MTSVITGRRCRASATSVTRIADVFLGTREDILQLTVADKSLVAREPDEQRACWLDVTGDFRREHCVDPYTSSDCDRMSELRQLLLRRVIAHRRRCRAPPRR